MELDYKALLVPQDQADDGTAPDATISSVASAVSAARRSHSFPGKIAIRHVIEAARSCGIDVRSLEVTSSGSIRVSAIAAPGNAEESDYDRLSRLGAL